MTTPPPYRRILRRETHSPRSGFAIALAVVLIFILAWIGTESVLALLGRPALLVAPEDSLGSVLGLPTLVTSSGIIGAGSAVAVIGLLIVLVALLPGRRARHTGVVGRTAVVVDNVVVASALARVASRSANVDPDQVVVTIGHRTVDVTVRPSSGFPVDDARVLTAVQEALTTFELTPALRVKVTIEQKGVVGA